MSNLVHYLIRHPTQKDGFIYPTELEDDTYVGCGAFFLLGTVGAGMRKAYKFHAVHDERLLETILHPFQNSNIFFQVEIENIGAFLFYAQPITKKLPYVGRSAQL